MAYRKVVVKKRRDNGPYEPIERLRPTEHNSSSVTLGNLLWG